MCVCVCVVVVVVVVDVWGGLSDKTAMKGLRTNKKKEEKTTSRTDAVPRTIKDHKLIIKITLLEISCEEDTGDS